MTTLMDVPFLKEIAMPDMKSELESGKQAMHARKYNIDTSTVWVVIAVRPITNNESHLIVTKNSKWRPASQNYM